MQCIFAPSVFSACLCSTSYQQSKKSNFCPKGMPMRNHCWNGFFWQNHFSDKSVFSQSRDLFCQLNQFSSSMFHKQPLEIQIHFLRSPKIDFLKKNSHRQQSEIKIRLCFGTSFWKMSYLKYFLRRLEIEIIPISYPTWFPMFKKLQIERSVFEHTIEGELLLIYFLINFIGLDLAS